MVNTGVQSLNARNVHAMLPLALQLITKLGVYEESRNGMVLVMPVPVSSMYDCPEERVIFWSQRDANPFFHFMEGLWMIGGREDVKFPASFAKQIAEYSDNGEVLYGAYGYRWRHAFGRDQLQWVVKKLKENPEDRRVVLSMWDPKLDPIAADSAGKDIPCNTQVYFRIAKIGDVPRLCMQVNCRSNDILWGAYGANAVHMSMMQEYLANKIGVEIGWYVQNSFNWHAYTSFLRKMLSRSSIYSYAKDYGIKDDDLKTCMSSDHYIVSPYEHNTKYRFKVEPYSLGADHEDWDFDLGHFLNGINQFKTPFFKEVAWPMLESHKAYKAKDYDLALEHIGRCAASDWRVACEEWLRRRRLERSNA